ncbi:MAG: YhdP family protein [Rhodoferax sp.]|nr:YhdP family protein [Rhodoferax sp.]
MNSVPTPKLRALATVAHWALRLLLVAWLALAMAWAGLHFLIVPRIGELRPWLEKQATQALGTTVEIGSITAISNGLIPTVALANVRLLDAQSREALSLPQVQVAFSPRSLLRGGFEQLFIDSPELEVRRTADGTFWIAGMPLPQTGGNDSAALDWLFSQPEVALKGGTVHWTDELRGSAVLRLDGVQVVLRNGLLRHALRVDANTPPDWGGAFTVMGVFSEPFLARNAGHWQSWSGQLYASFPQVDLAYLRQYVDIGVDLARGSGALRAWLDVDQGKAQGATADVRLQDVQLTAGARLEALALRSVSGRVGAHRLANGGGEWFTQALQFETDDKLVWPGGNVQLRLWEAQDRSAARGELVADRLDLAAVHALAQRLPVGDAVQQALNRLAPKGLVDRVQGQWSGPVARPTTFAVKGRVSGLDIAAVRDPAQERPGVQGLQADFDITEAGGAAQLALDKGVLDAQGLLDDGPVYFEKLQADLAWTHSSDGLTVTGKRLHFANADGQGDLQFTWRRPLQVVHNGKPVAERGPGWLDLEGTLARVEGARVHRYLPLVLDKEVRDYVRGAVLGGTASGAKFKVKGDLGRFPFEDAKQGEFRISANVKNVNFAFVPDYLLPKGSLSWPSLQQLDGELIIDHATLTARAQRGRLGSTGVQISNAQGVITQIYSHAQLQVTADAKGPLADALDAMTRSPLGGLMGHVLDQASATGAADLKLKLDLPIADVNHATVTGALVLNGNDLALGPEIPRLQRVRGTMSFTEAGFSVANATARALGGDVRLDGGINLATVPAGARALAPSTLKLQGTATADGLRQAKELGALTRLADGASGSTSYSATVGLRGGALELLVNSGLQGLALSLPAPFGKTAESSLPVRFEMGALRGAPARPQDQLRLDIGQQATAIFQRDLSGVQARVLRGAIGIGLADDETAPLPDDGVVANINLPALDLDAWGQVFGRMVGDAKPAAGNGVVPGASVATGYLPTVLAVRTRELTVAGRKLHNMVVGGGREGLIWRANLDASELNGYVEYRQAAGTNAGQVYARLARLAIGQSTAQDVENLLDEQPASIPALDIEVDDFELRGKRLGRVVVAAVNLGGTGSREWRLNQFDIQTPEARMTATGNWAALGTAPAAGRSIQERRRTVLNFKLDILDAGEVLSRFGTPGVVRKGKGKVEGQVAWLGSPLTVDYPSMTGNFNVNVESGQFLKADPGIAKLLGVLSLQSLPRRLTLDFRDLFSEGFAFDYFRGDVAITQGIARTTNLQMKGVAAAVLMDGQADIAKETQNLRVVVVPELNAGSASLIASIVNPVVGLSTFLAQLVLRGPLVNAATREFTIDGTWLEPRVTQVERKP